MTAATEALEALGHARGALPEPRLLADLFSRFQAQVPLRRAPAGLGGDELLAAWLEDGTGCCGAARTAAFESLARAAGFAFEGGTARAGSGAARRVLLADRGGLLLDPGFPLPAPLRLDPPSGDEPTGYGTLSVRPLRESGAEVRLETRGEERRLFDVTPGEPPGPHQDPGEGAPGLLFRLLPDRLLRWRGGVLEISDAWSRLRFPLPASDADGLEAFFGPPAPDGGETPAGAGSDEPSLAVYHGVEAEPARLLELLADPVFQARLLPEGWTAAELSRRDGGFARTLFEEGTLLRKERVTFLPDGVAVEAEGPLAVFRTRTWRLEERPGGTRLRILAALRDPVPPRGLAEGTRRRLVFELASELLALERLAAEG